MEQQPVVADPLPKTAKLTPCQIATGNVFTRLRIAWALGIGLWALLWLSSCDHTEKAIDAPVASLAADAASPNPCAAPSPIPVVLVDLPSVPKDREKVDAKFQFYDVPNRDGRYDPSGSVFQKGSGTVHARGQGSLGFPKNSFAINLDTETPLMGMPPSKKWVMIGNWVDTTQLANKMSYDFYAQMGHYGPRSRHVQVCFNGEYWGLYTFGERVTRGEGRVDTKKASDGGFIVKLVDAELEFCSVTDREFQYEYPAEDEATPTEKENIKSTINQYENAVMAGDDWRQYLDEDAEIDYFLLTDAFANPDSYYNDKNLFYFLNKNNKLEPVIWDFIWAFGPPFYTKSGNNPPPTWPKIYNEGMLMYGVQRNDYYRYTVGYDQFCLMRYYRSDTQNLDKLKKRYKVWRDGPLSAASIEAQWAKLVEPLVEKVYGDQGVYDLDKARWGWGDRRNPDFTPSELKQKLLARLNLMDTVVPALTTSGSAKCPLEARRPECLAAKK